MLSAYLLRFAISLQFLISLSSSASLYSPRDPLWELDSTNFERVIFGKSHAWIVEFYNNWCGHCIRFAPEWKAFARDIETWGKVIDVAVVNCAESQNLKLCRNYNVDSYPTIKLFPPFTNSTERGIQLNTGNRDLNSIEAGIIDYVESLCSQKPQDNWPVFQPLEFNNLTSIIKYIPDDLGSILLFVESPYSLTGRKVIMDISFHNKTSMRRVLLENAEPLLRNGELITDIKHEDLNSSLPILFKVYQSGEVQTIFRFSEDSSSDYIRDEIFKFVVGHPRNKTEVNVVDPKKPAFNKKITVDSVHMADLENSVYYSLNQEVGVVKDIFGERLLALKSYVLLLKTLFPGTPPVVEYLYKVNDWLSNKKGSLRGEEFVDAIKQLQGKTEILKMSEYVGCKGSEPKYRGYPCSLWTLFHTLTVAADSMHEDKHGYMNYNATIVFLTIKNYIKYFFTCEECAKNFGKMAKIMDREIKAPEDAVLWFWEAHNRVNSRLAGDATEDPKHPKIQFPSPEMCQRCRNQESDGSLWDKSLVLRYLRHFYGKENIVIEESNELTGAGVGVQDSHSYHSMQMLNAIKRNVPKIEKHTGT